MKRYICGIRWSNYFLHSLWFVMVSVSKESSVASQYILLTVFRFKLFCHISHLNTLSRNSNNLCGYRRTRCKSHIFVSLNSEVTHCGSPHSDVDHLIEHLPPGMRNFAMHARSDRSFDGLLNCDITVCWFILFSAELF